MRRNTRHKMFFGLVDIGIAFCYVRCLMTNNLIMLVASEHEHCSINIDETQFSHDWSISIMIAAQ